MALPARLLRDEHDLQSCAIHFLRRWLTVFGLKNSWLMLPSSASIALGLKLLRVSFTHARRCDTSLSGSCGDTHKFQYNLETHALAGC